MCGIVISSDRKFLISSMRKKQGAFWMHGKLPYWLCRQEKMSFPQWSTWTRKHRICTFCMCLSPKDGRLCAKDIYTKAALKKLQDEMPRFLQEHGFKIERGVEQEKGSAKKHLDTKEFKQQQEMLENLADRSRKSTPVKLKRWEEQLEEQKQEETDLNERMAKQKRIYHWNWE